MGTHPIFESDFDCLTEKKNKKMASQSEGIQRLLEAENDAKKLLDAARRQKAIKLKQAKEEAKIEISKFTKEREAEFKAKEAEILGGRDELEKQINVSTESKLAEMSHRVQQREMEVISNLVAQVANVVPQLPRNYVATEGV